MDGSKNSLSPDGKPYGIQYMLTELYLRTIARFKKWMEQTNEGDTEKAFQPDYPLMPLTRGFVLCMEKALKEYEKGLNSLNIREGSVTGGGD